MKKIIILPLLFLGFISWGQAQFIVQNGSKTEVYTSINTAIENAVAGDTLYIPGGGFGISNTSIDKTLHWVGHGHYPDSTSATMQTRITSTLSFSGNCDNSSFEGILFTGSLSFGSADDEPENIKIKRCSILGNLTLRGTTTGNPVLNFQVQESVIKNVYANYGSMCTIEKTQIFGVTESFYNSTFTHNNFNVSASYPFRNCQSCTFQDNIFSYSYGLGYASSNSFLYNVFQGGIPYGANESNSGNHNIYNLGSANIYTDISHSTNIYTFSYNNDYHLNTSSTGIAEEDGSTVSIHQTASDATNAGIYGTATPYKTIPYYPHINTANIASEAVNDQLGVNINVAAQSR